MVQRRYFLSYASLAEFLQFLLDHNAGAGDRQAQGGPIIQVVFTMEPNQIKEFDYLLNQPDTQIVATVILPQPESNGL